MCIKLLLLPVKYHNRVSRVFLTPNSPGGGGGGGESWVGFYFFMIEKVGV